MLNSHRAALPCPQWLPGARSTIVRGSVAQSGRFDPSGLDALLRVKRLLFLTRLQQ